MKGKKLTEAEWRSVHDSFLADAQLAYDIIFAAEPPTRSELRRWRQPFAWPDHDDCPRANAWHELRHAQRDAL
jgi:hypothetical protein